MRKQSLLPFFFSLILIFTSCTDNRLNVMLDKMTAAETAPAESDILPLGLHFGMTMEEFNDCLSKQEGDIVKRAGGNFYYYNLKLSTGTFKCYLFPEFWDEKDSLSLVTLSFRSRTNEFVSSKNIPKLLKGLQEKYKSLDGGNCFIGDKDRHCIDFNYWIDKNAVILFEDESDVALFGRESYDISLSFFDANKRSASGQVLFLRDVLSGVYSGERNGSNTNDSKVVYNNAWDGSVRQVKKYIVSTLYYPDSYESMEWGEVTPIDGGFQVYHKYKAKNALGATVVESHTYTLDSKGRIYSVE